MKAAYFTALAVKRILQKKLTQAQVARAMELAQERGQMCVLASDISRAAKETKQK